MRLISSPRFANHLTPPGHPESPERAEIFDGVAERARLRGVEVVEPAEAPDDALLRIHTRAHLAAISATSGKASMLDPDTYTSPETATLAKLAAGAAILAVDHCLTSAHAPRGGDSPQWHGFRAIGDCPPHRVDAGDFEAGHVEILGQGRDVNGDVDQLAEPGDEDLHSGNCSRKRRSFS